MYALSLASTEAVSFDVCFASNLTHADNKVLQAVLAGRRALLVTTPTVARLYGDRTLPRHPDLRVAPEWKGFLGRPVSPVFRVATVIVSLHRRCAAALGNFAVAPATAKFATVALRPSG